jgi:hypothetical protein
MFIRRCERCGRLDLRERYDTLKQAAACGVWEERWWCRSCLHRSFELVDHDVSKLDVGGRSGASG